LECAACPKAASEASKLAFSVYLSVYFNGPSAKFYKILYNSILKMFLSLSVFFNWSVYFKVLSVFKFAEVSVGQHLYWNFFGFPVHAQVLMTSWVVLSILIVLSLLANQNLSLEPKGLQNFTEYITEFIRDLAKTQIGESEGLSWVPFLGTIFLFIFVSNWSGALFPWKIIELPNGELAAPTNDINTTVALALLTSFSYFFAGFQKLGLNYFKRYISPVAFLLPINVLEDFTKPLSLSFRLFGNILADELVVGVLITLVPLIVPIPLMLLGLFTSGATRSI